MQSSRVARVVLASLVCLATVAGVASLPAAAAPGDCFGDGRDLTVGTEGPTIELTIHTSLFTNLTSAGAFGLSAVGTTGDADIVDLQVGVVFVGVGDVSEFLADPFSRFALVFDYTLSLPMFDAVPGETTYEQADAPVEGVPEAECSTGDDGN
ncbi:DUF7332 family protein [Halobaculum marinum]|uniref:Choice-of-anchor E domain-containing protein n=1 Tax=Halobaculum marinum TaxID=3031996 RepID=A0ABD5WXQ6_9EURY|nr:hypothetical protein [Halobaculum sp. DT55]